MPLSDHILNTLVVSSLAGRPCALSCKEEMQRVSDSRHQAGEESQSQVGMWFCGLVCSAQHSPAPGSGQGLQGLKTSDKNLCCCLIAREMKTEIGRLMEKSHRKFLLFYLLPLLATLPQT